MMQEKRERALVLLSGVLQDGAAADFARAMREDDPALYARAYAKLLEEDKQRSFADYLGRAILYDDNLFARRAFLGKADGDVRAAFLHDMAALQALAARADDLPPRIAAEVEAGLPRIECGASPFGSEWGAAAMADNLAAFYRANGYGMFIDNKAFTFEKGALVPVRNAPDVTLDKLKDYEEEKRIIEDNVINFLRGLPYSNMLLYGDKGTGKSSTVHAMLNKYAPAGLRAAELTKEKVGDAALDCGVLAALPFKFLLFIDDLSLEEKDEKVTALKAGLEGSMHEKSDNVMIVATSNRRHILKENFSDRENSVHARDTMEEQLSLSDRFGLTVCFSSTGKKEYLSIVRQLAADDGIALPDEQLCALAERWALVKGGRSPRRARQFVDYLYACQAKGTEIVI